MKVGIVCGGGIVSGKEIMVLQLADGLRNAGMEVEVVSSYWSDGKFSARLEALRIPTHKVWFGFLSATRDWRCIYMTLAQLARWPQLLAGYASFVRRFKPERVVHTNWHGLLTLSPFLKRNREIYWVHEVLPSKLQYRVVFRFLDRRVQRFVAVSAAVANSLQRIGIEARKVSVIYNGLPTPNLSAGNHSNSDGRMVVGIVGQIGPWKGHEDLLQAFQHVVNQHPDALLDIYGSGSPDYEEFLKARAVKLGLADKIRWQGFEADSNKIYTAMSMLVVPSRSEDPLPTVAIEAAFYQIPVVASARGGLLEIVEQGVTGFLFPVGDVAAMARYIQTLLGDPDLRKMMGANARIRAEKLFDRTQFIDQFKRAIQQEA